MTATPGIRTTMGICEWAMLLVLSAIWGGSYFFNGVAVTSLPTLTIVTLRVGLGAAFLWIFVLAMGIPLPASRRAWIELLWMGVLNNVFPFTLLVWGQTQIESGLAAILNATTPLFTVTIACVMLTDERITWLKATGVIIGLVGAIVVIGPEALMGLGGDLLPQIACVAAGVFYAVSAVFGRRFKKQGVHPMTIAVGTLTCSSVLMIPVALAVDQPWLLSFPSPAVWGSILGLALLSTAAAYYLYFRILGSAGATNAVLVTFLIPVSAILLGYLVLGERLAALDFIGMGIIALGLALVDGRLVRKQPS